MPEIQPSQTPAFRPVRLQPEEIYDLFSAEELANHLRSIQWVTDAALAHLKVDALLGELLRRIRRILEVDVVRALLCTEEGNTLAVRASLGLENTDGDEIPVPIGQGLAGWVAYHLQPVIVDDVSAVPVANPLIQQLASAMVAPLVVEGRIIGVLKVGSLAPRRFGVPDLGVLQLVADRVALALDRAATHERILAGERERALEEHRRRTAETGLQEQLRGERARLEAVLRQLPAGVLIAEAPSGRIIQGNDRVRAILGHEVLASEGIHEYHEWKAVRADGAPFAPDEWPLSRAIRRGETVTGEEMLYERPDGTRIWLRANAAPIRDESGAIVAGVTVFHDIDVEKRSADKLRFLVDASSTLHSTLDYAATLRKVAHLAVPRFADWCLVDLVDGSGRPRHQEMAHGDPRREAEVRALMRRFPTDYSDAEHPIRVVLQTGEPILLREITDEILGSLARDPEHREIIRALGVESVLIVPLRVRERVTGVLTFATAESRRRFTEEDLSLAMEVAWRSAVAIENADLFAAASAANRAKEDFLAVMSHELRTPLAAIMGYAELLQMGIPVAVPEPALHQVERIDTAARHQLALVEEILTFSRLSAGSEVLTERREDLRVPVTDALAFVRPIAEQKGLELRADIPPAPVECHTDGAKVRQILGNLLLNAVQFTPGGTVETTVEREGEEVRVHVRDTGIGIAPEYHERIFEPFWQVRQSSTREVGGTGLGLTVARHTARLIGGDIEVESVPAGGTRFTLRIPCGGPGEPGG